MEKKKDNELNISDLLNILRARWLTLLIVGVLTAAIGFCYSYFFIVPQYRASAKMMVDTRTDFTTSITSSQLSTAKQLALTYAEVIKTNAILNPVIEELGLEESFGSLNSKFTVSVVEDTQMLQLYIVDTDPDRALKIIEKIVELAPGIMNEKFSSSYILSVDIPVVTSSPISPNIPRNTVFAFIVGFAGVYIYFLIKRLLDNKFKSADDIGRILDIPVLGVIPALENISSK